MQRCGIPLYICFIVFPMRNYLSVPDGCVKLRSDYQDPRTKARIGQLVWNGGEVVRNLAEP